MTVTVASLNSTQTYDQPGATFEVLVQENASPQLRVIAVGADGEDGNVVAIYWNWDYVRTDAFDVAAQPPTASAPEATTANPAPPEPAPVAPEEAPAPVTTPGTPEVPADTTVVPLTDTEGTEVTPETPLESPSS